MKCLDRLTLGSEDAAAALEARECLIALGRRPDCAQKLYVNLVQQRKLAAADLVLTHLLPPATAQARSIWPWRIIHAAMAAVATQVQYWLGRAPKNLKLSFKVWRRMVVECQNNRIGCGAQLRALFLPDLPAHISIAAMLRHPAMPPDDFWQHRIDKIIRTRAALGLESPASYIADCRRAPMLDAALYTYVLDHLGADGVGQDCVLPFVTVEDNPDWLACLNAARPFVLACFHAGPVVDASWPARSAKVPLFHFALTRGCRASPSFYSTEQMTPAEFSAVAREIVKRPSGVIIAPEVGRGLRDTGLLVGGEKLELSPFPAYIAHRTGAEVFFMRSEWKDDGIVIKIITGPRPTEFQPREAWEGTFNAAYAEQMKAIVSGEGLNNLRY